MCVMESRGAESIPLCCWGLQENCACYKSDPWNPYNRTGAAEQMWHQGGPFLISVSGQNKKKDNKERKTQYNKGLEVRLGKINIINRYTFYSLPAYTKAVGIMISGVLEIHSKRLSFALLCLYVFSNPMIKGQCILLFDGILFYIET